MDLTSPSLKLTFLSGILFQGLMGFLFISVYKGILLKILVHKSLWMFFKIELINLLELNKPNKLIKDPMG